MTEDWEFDFHNPPRIPPPQEGDMDNPFKSFFHLKPKNPVSKRKRQPCANDCGQACFPDMEIFMYRHVGRSTEVHVVCSEKCRDELFLKLPRRAGL